MVMLTLLGAMLAAGAPESAESGLAHDVCSLPEFSPSAPHIKLSPIVFAWRRLISLQRTLRSLEDAVYCGKTVPLKVLLDGGAAPAVVDYVVSFNWTHGPKQVLSFGDWGLSLGIRGMWTNCTSPDMADDEHIIPLEDDIQVSSLYYWFLLRTASAYAPPAVSSAAQPVYDKRLFGVSLYTPRLNEIHYPQVKWLPDQETGSSLFLLQVPCSWGALYFGYAWKEFLEFYATRVRAPFFDFAQERTQKGIGGERQMLGDPYVAIPGSRSNVWPRSWKRFMIDFMYGRGGVFLYPNLKNQRSFSTTYMERGGHSGKDGRVEALQLSALRKDIDPAKTVPLLRTNELAELLAAFAKMPSISSLPVFDLHHSRRPSRDLLVSQGFAFTENVRWWGRWRTLQERALRPEDHSVNHAAIYSHLAGEWCGVRSPDGPRGGCAMDALWPEHAAAAAAPHSPAAAFWQRAVSSPAADAKPTTKYLVYQPPGGVGEWFVALKNAVGVAHALRRTLVVPHLLWDGGLSNPVAYSQIFDFESLRKVIPEVIEMDDFTKLGLAPSRIVLLHVKEPRLLPSRSYFNAVASWANVSALHMPAQMCDAADYVRLYGACAEQVLAFSNLYAAFEGFYDQRLQSWLDHVVFPAAWGDTQDVSQKAASLVHHLIQDTGSFTCLHLTAMDTAVLTARSGGGAAQEIELTIDVAEPAAHSVPFHVTSAESLLREPSTVCEGYDAEAQSPLGRRWVKELLEGGMACQLSEDELGASLGMLPRRHPVFVVADGGRALPEALAKHAAGLLNIDFHTLPQLAQRLAIKLDTYQSPAVEHHVCSRADTLLGNAYSPLSSLLSSRARSYQRGRSSAARSQQLPAELFWSRVDSDACMALFTRTARFDIQPNRFGILGQFGPDRKLQLATTNISTLIGWDGRLVPNGTIEMEIYVSNASHHLHIFEYTKENNQKGIQFTVPTPAGGWVAHHWHSFTIPVREAMYTFPMSTPWDAMNRLELYYAYPHAAQLRGDYVRIRNVYVRSSRSYQKAAGLTSEKSCKELSSEARLPMSTGSSSWLAAQRQRQRQDVGPFDAMGRSDRVSTSDDGAAALSSSKDPQEPALQRAVLGAALETKPTPTFWLGAGSTIVLVLVFARGRIGRHGHDTSHAARE